jgi:hypothetical protein
MASPATLILHFTKTGGNSLWPVIIEDAKTGQVKEVSGECVGSLYVDSFSLEDHQFVKVEFARKKGGKAVDWIPRAIVLAIIEGKAEAAAGYYFAGAEAK